MSVSNPAVSFLPVPSTRIRAGVRAGLVSAAATAGAIIGFGLRHHDWSTPFVSLGIQVLQGLGLTNPPLSVSSAAGIAAHVAWMVVWGIGFGLLAYRRTPATAALLALGIGVVAALSARVIPPALGAVNFAALPTAQVVLCVALLSVGLITGRALSATD